MQGKILAGRYRLVHQLGKGGMGSVWTAEHLSLHSAVAVKLLDTEIAKNPQAVERFQREAQAAATLRSAHVVQVLDYGVEEQLPFLVMELLQGEDLGARLGRVGTLSPEALLVVLQQVARAVSRAHDAGIVHRDLKPENIFLVNEGDHEVVKVLDFGIAKSVAPGFAPSATRTGVTMGTPYYMSPEQAEGKRDVDHRTDLWALGVIASECLTGMRPFDGETFGELLLNICARPAPIPSTLALVPRHFDIWFAKATHRDPEARFANVQQLVSTFADVVAGRAPAGIDTLPMRTAPMDGPVPAAPRVEAPAPQRPVPTHGNAAVTLSPEDPPSIPVTNRWVLPAGAVVVVAALGLGAFWFFGSSSTTAPSPSAALALSSSGPDLPNISAAGPSAENPASPAPLHEPVTPVTPTTKHATAASIKKQKQPAEPAGAATPTPPQKPERLEPASGAEAPKAVPATTPAAVPKPTPSLRCVSDPFTGALKPAGAGLAGSVACRQNPFSGQYQRL